MYFGLYFWLIELKLIKIIYGATLTLKIQATDTNNELLFIPLLLTLLNTLYFWSPSVPKSQKSRF